MSNSCYCPRLLLNYTFRAPCLWNVMCNARRLCGKAPGSWESCKKEEGTGKMCLNAQIKNSFQYSSTLLTVSIEMRDAESQPLVASLPVEKADSGHISIFTCRSGLVCIWAGAPPPLNIFYLHSESVFVTGHWPLRFQAVIMSSSPWGTGLLLLVSDYFR